MRLQGFLPEGKSCNVLSLINGPHMNAKEIKIRTLTRAPINFIIIFAHRTMNKTIGKNGFNDVSLICLPHVHET